MKLVMLNELKELVEGSPHNGPHVHVSTSFEFLFKKVTAIVKTHGLSISLWVWGSAPTAPNHLL